MPTLEPTPRHARVPNPIYHPGATESLDLSGTLHSPNAAEVKFTGKITEIVTRETLHGKPINVMNFGIEVRTPDGNRQQTKIESAYELQSDGGLKLIYRDLGSGRRWVDSTTCAREPSEFIDGHAQGCEVHYDDGSTDNDTTSATRDGDNIKVTDIEQESAAGGEHKEDSSATLWFDLSTGHIVRYSATMTGQDGTQMTISGE